MVTFQLEPWETYERDAQELWQRHAEGIGATLPMGVDGPFYAFLERCGQLLILTARDAGRMVGYVVVIVRRHPHYVSTLCGFEDGYFLEPQARKGRTGLRMLQASLLHLKARGVKRVIFHSKMSVDLAKLFQHMHFTETDRLWSKDL